MAQNQNSEIVKNKFVKDKHCYLCENEFSKKNFILRHHWNCQQSICGYCSKGQNEQRSCDLCYLKWKFKQQIETQKELLKIKDQIIKQKQDDIQEIKDKIVIMVTQYQNLQSEFKISKSKDGDDVNVITDFNNCKKVRNVYIDCELLQNNNNNSEIIQNESVINQLKQKVNKIQLEYNQKFQLLQNKEQQREDLDQFIEDYERSETIIKIINFVKDQSSEDIVGSIRNNMDLKSIFIENRTISKKYQIDPENKSLLRPKHSMNQSFQVKCCCLTKCIIF